MVKSHSQHSTYFLITTLSKFNTETYLNLDFVRNLKQTYPVDTDLEIKAR